MDGKAYFWPKIELKLGINLRINHGKAPYESLRGVAGEGRLQAVSFHISVFMSD